MTAAEIHRDIDPEERFAARIDEIAGDAARHGELLALLREDHPLYDGRGAATTVRMRGWILATLARTGVTDEALLFVLEELDTGIDPYLVAAAARALRAYPQPRAAFAPLVVGAIANVRYRDERVSFESFGAYAIGKKGTTPVAELLESLRWLGPHARAILPELEELRRSSGLARRYAAQMDAAAAEITGAESAREDCCGLPESRFVWPFGARRRIDASARIVLEDHDGNAIELDALVRGHVTIVVFFYTRCDNPLKCSLTIAKLARVQQRLEEGGLTGQIQTAAITYDPAFDVAERLRTYGRERGVRLDAQHRMLRATEGFDALRRRFELGVNFVESLVNRHRVEAYILDRDGRVAASFLRLRWDEEELVARSVEVLREEPPERRKVAMPVAGTLATLAFAFFPKCAVCWAAYLSMFGIAGLSQIPYAPWLKPAFAALMLLNIASVWIRNRATGRMTGFYLVSGGALAILPALQFGWKSAAAIGVALTMAGSVVSAFAGRGAAARNARAEIAARS
jgi:protein SCO1/2